VAPRYTRLRLRDVRTQAGFDLVLAAAEDGICPACGFRMVACATPLPAWLCPCCGRRLTVDHHRGCVLVRDGHWHASCEHWTDAAMTGSVRPAAMTPIGRWQPWTFEVPTERAGS
jgi:predicted amidophosphoribosyltransferase